MKEKKSATVAERESKCQHVGQPVYVDQAGEDGEEYAIFCQNCGRPYHSNGETCLKDDAEFVAQLINREVFGVHA